MKKPIPLKDKIKVNKDFLVDNKLIKNGIYNIKEFMDLGYISTDTKSYSGNIVCLDLGSYSSWWIPYSKEYCSLFNEDRQLEFEF